MGFLDGLLGSPKRDTLPSGVTVRHFRTTYKDRLLAHFDAAFPGRETLVWDDADTGIELSSNVSTLIDNTGIISLYFRTCLSANGSVTSQ